MENEDLDKTTLIECSCGTHLLQINSSVEKAVDSKDGTVRYWQEYYLAMFYYGIESHKRKWWQRIPIALKYLKSGKMFSDQLCLTPQEANKVATFINETLVEKL